MSEEPVAYRVYGVFYNNLQAAEFAVREINGLRKELNMGNGLIERPPYIEPLYKEKQVQPKVKMNTEQYNSFYKYWKELFEEFGQVNYIIMLDQYFTFGQIPDALDHNDKLLKEIINIWDIFDPDNPEETIEVIPEKKWFVENIDDDSEYRFLKVELDNKLFSNKTLKKYATYFDTKEEAELWVNPLCEAILLPIDGSV